MIRIAPILFVTDVEASRRFYGLLGLDLDLVSRPGNFIELTAGGGGMVGLHSAATTEVSPGQILLAFDTDEGLEVLAERLAAAGFEPEGILDENYGRSLRVLDPDGVLVNINDHDTELYR